MGKTAWIELSQKKINIEETDPELLEKYIGSRGIAAKVLYDHVDESIMPYDAKNKLIFSVGPFTGSSWPSAAGYTVTAKSPATGAYGYANGSGYFGAEIRKAGYDLLVFSGKASQPVYVYIEDDVIEILDAQVYWGLETDDVGKKLRQEHKESCVACIGPAGENKVVCANIISDDGWAASRCGMGAVMGDKNLKAVVVKAKYKPKTPKAFMNVVRRVTPEVRNHPRAREYSKWGSAILLDQKNKIGDNPTKNHSYGQFPGHDKIDARVMKKYSKKTGGCHACSVKCARYTEVKELPYKTATHLGPGWETINALGANVWNDNPELLIYCNKLCTGLGIDPTSVGGMIAFAMEAKEKGLLQDKTYNLAWGDADTMIGLIKDIAHREGDLGQLLADGVKNAGEQIGHGAEALALHCKNLELPGQDGRAVKAMGLGQGISNRGGDHLYALPNIDTLGDIDLLQSIPELAGCGPDLMDPTKTADKARMVRFTETCNAVADALGICKISFPDTYAISINDLAQGLYALGIDTSGEQLMEIGQRIVNLERMYNVRHGLRKVDDMLPERFIKEGLDVYTNPEDIEGIPVEEAELIHRDLKVDMETLLQEYYRLGGWMANGVPSVKRLKELELDACVSDFPLK